MPSIDQLPRMVWIAATGVLSLVGYSLLGGSF